MIENFLCLQKNCGDLEVRIEELSICNKMGNNSFISGEFGEEQGCESNRYRIKENIGWIKNDSIKINNSRLGSMSEIK